MPDNITFRSPLLFFFSRFLILCGMVLSFYSLFAVIGFLILKPIFGINVMNDFSILSNFENNATVINALKFLQGIIPIGAFIVPALYFPKAIQQDSKSFLQINTSVKPIFFLYALAIIIFSMPFISMLIDMNKNISFPTFLSGLENSLRADEEIASKLTKAFLSTDSTAGFLINILVIALIPAICEEFLFRGTLQQFITLCFKNKHIAVWTAAVLFSAFHMQFFGFLPRLILGVFLGYLFAYSGSIWPSVVAHFINNALSLSAEHFKFNESGIDFLKDDFVFPWYLNLLSVVLSCTIIYFMHLHQSRKINYNGE